MTPFHHHHHHNRHRRLLSQSPDPLSNPTHFDKSLIISFTAALCAALVYLILNSLLKCTQCIRRRRQEHPPARGTEQDPDSLAQLRAIPVQVYDGPASCSANGPEAEICLVCLAEYEAGEEVRVLPGCGHVFHRACIDPWLITRSSSCCPICRDRVIRRSVEPTVAGCSRDGYNNGIGAGDGAVRFVMGMEANILPTHPSSVL